MTLPVIYSACLPLSKSFPVVANLNSQHVTQDSLPVLPSQNDHL